MSSKELRSSREKTYFIISIIFSSLLYIFAIASLFGIAILLIILALLLYVNAIMLGSIRGNGIRISEKQFPDVYERVVSLSSKMDLKKVPDVFVINSEGAFNAFATRFLGRNMVVIYSEVFELAREHGEAELDFIIAHELSHVKRRHVWKNILIMPAQFIPFLSQAYSRSCEYTCDREAAYYIQNGAAAKHALTILGVGKKLYTEVNENAYLEQIHTESNVAVWLSEILSSHPLLPKRIQAVGNFMRIEGTPKYYSNSTKIALGIGALLGIFFAIYIGAIALFAAGTLTYANLFSGSILDESLTSGEPYSYDDNSLTPLMEAVLDYDEVKVQELVSDGESLEDQDSEKTTALLLSIYNDNDSIAHILLEAGANPNTADNFSNALTVSLYNENYKLAKLLYSYGADPSIEDPEGFSAFSILDVDNENDFLASLKNF
ncbi:Zn-dependent protease with chaperone function [Psychrobacillus insolitus]|uniref:Zn-dependent protease with chaperone function n=1 Tax=Psychrobacillus insolitus TaxID=1461 RepID=A0A2W7MDU5_9BACI|nr:M48 family metallopeptidase [Psychrobacillus insolitus]PZX02925.1 Zn-dependent protease with chaperone function [Psychrobacillus insolitus]